MHKKYIDKIDLQGSALSAAEARTLCDRLQDGSRGLSRVPILGDIEYSSWLVLFAPGCVIILPALPLGGGYQQLRVSIMERV